MVVDVLVFERCERCECAVTAGAVVEDLEVLEHRGAELDACLPFLAVEELRFESGLKGFDRRVVKRHEGGASW